MNSKLKETDIEIINHALPIRELVLFACGVQQEGVGDYADLEGAYLRGADLEGASLRGANLQGADLQWADLEGVNLRNANLGVTNQLARSIRLLGACWEACEWVDKQNRNTWGELIAICPRPDWIEWLKERGLV